MSYVILSFTHKNSDLPVREKLAFDNTAKQQAVLESVHANKFIDESMVLSTCNRVEFLLFVRDCQKALDFLLEYLAEFSGLELDYLRTSADIYT
ncbi:MAG: glutamyl-tRNA reductase, partial [Helicobacter sp.]|nr:glutamyl-tRNA reductase [Helicobacter sp.]